MCVCILCVSHLSWNVADFNWSSYILLLVPGWAWLTIIRVGINYAKKLIKHCQRIMSFVSVSSSPSQVECWVWRNSDKVSRRRWGLSEQLLTVSCSSAEKLLFPLLLLLLLLCCFLLLLQLPFLLLLLLLILTMLRLTVYSSNLIANFVPRQLQLAPASVGH